MHGALLRRLAAPGVLACLALCGTAAEAAAPIDRYPKAADAYVIAIDGEIRWARNADQQRPPASLTKLLTAMLALESGWDPDAIVTVSANAAAQEGTRLAVRTGEQLRAGDALVATLVRSANDVCTALAEHVAGTVEKFVARMNARAIELGLTASHFRNPCGLDAPGHVSSARDLMRLSELAMAVPEIARIVALPGAGFSSVKGRKFSFQNNNALIGRLPGAIGIKSGFTSKAGKCVAAMTERNGRRVLVILLDSPDRWWTAAGLTEEAFHSLAAEPGVR